MERWIYLQLALLLPLPKWPACSEGVSAGFGDWNKSSSSGREVCRKDLSDPLGMGTGVQGGCSSCSPADLGLRLGTELSRAQGD